MPRPAALILDRVSVQYGAKPALRELSLDVRPGEILALLGQNGSGKSTTLSVAAGILDSGSGNVIACGINRKDQPEAYARKIGLVPQEPALYDDLTAEANLIFFGRLFGLSGYDLRCRVAMVLDRVQLTARSRDRVRTFSGGLKQRLNLACALIHDPPLLLLDEPTAALDPRSRDLLFADLHRLRDAGHAVLLSTHHLDEAEHGCDRIAVLDQGQLAMIGKPAELVRHQPGGKAILYGHLREHLPAFFEKSLRKRLGRTIELEITGRRIRLAAETQEALGQALATVLSDGVMIDTFRTPPGRLEMLVHQERAVTPQGETCDAN
jgi:ABC-2 type transport system ATP-binding protein